MIPKLKRRGRKPLDKAQKRGRVTITLDPEILKYFKRESNKSELIDTLLRQHYFVRKDVSIRLNQSLAEINKARRSPLSIAHVADMLKLERAGIMYDYFDGRVVPSEIFLERYAKLFGINSNWLKFGKGKIFEINLVGCSQSDRCVNIFPRVVELKFRRVIIPNGLEVIMEIWVSQSGESMQVCQNSPNPSDEDETEEEAWQGWLFTVNQALSNPPRSYLDYVSSTQDWDRYYARVDWDKHAPCIVSHQESEGNEPECIQVRSACLRQRKPLTVGVDIGRVYKEGENYLILNLDRSVVKL